MVRLPSDPPGTRSDVWNRCPHAAIEPWVKDLVQRYWDCKAEGIPVLSEPIDDWPVTTLMLSRIIRAEEAHAQPKTDKDKGKAAAEAQRRQMADEMLRGNNPRRARRGRRHV